MMEGFYSSIKNTWVRAVTGGAILAILIFIFPPLYGEGYDVITLMINGDAGSALNGSFFYNDRNTAWVIYSRQGICHFVDQRCRRRGRNIRSRAARRFNGRILFCVHIEPIGI